MRKFGISASGFITRRGLSAYAYARQVIRVRTTIKHLIRDILIITLGVFSAGFGLKGFLLPNSLIDGGITGVSLIINRLTSLDLGLLVIIINIPFIWLGYRQVSRVFGIRSGLAIVGLSLVLAFVDFPIITHDRLLISVFGGFFLGAGIGLAVRGGAVIDGTEVLAVYLTRGSGLTIGDFILLFNVILFSIAAWLFDVETALYSILIYLAASKTVDYIVEGVDEYLGVMIISPHSDEIREMIVKKLGKGVTVFCGKRGYTRKSLQPANIEIVYTVITRLEVGRLRKEIEQIDPNAFIVINNVKDAVGGMIKQKTIAH
ncbi:MAG: YitT family protein [Bacteroidales bacterium]